MKTIEQFMADLAKDGKTVVEWAEEHDFPLWAVYRVTSGGTKGRRGRYHQIMVAMGIKPAGANQQAA
jgi:gp16 family phage-associated protein